MTRRILFWTHLSLGVAAGAVILVMSVTGLALAFQRQILERVDGGLRTVSAPADSSPRRLGEMLDAVTASAGSQPSGVVLRPGPTAAVEFTFADLDRAAAVAGAQRSDWRTLSLRIPAPDETVVVVTLDAGGGG